MTTLEKFTVYRPGCVEIPITLTCLSDEIWEDEGIPNETLVEILMPYLVWAVEHQIEKNRP